MNFYDSIIDGAQELPEQERGQLYTAVLEYLYYGREPDFKMRPTPRGMFVMLRPVLDNQRAKQAAGSKGGKARAKRQANPKQEPSKTQADGKQSPSRPAGKAQANPKQEPSRPTSTGHAEAQAKLWQSPSEQEQEQEREKPPTDVGGEKRPPAPRPFVPPSAEEVARVARERNLTLVDPEAFWAHYDAQGWVNGNGIPLVSWESKLISWNSAERLRQQEARQGGAYDATYD